PALRADGDRVVIRRNVPEIKGARLTQRRAHQEIGDPPEIAVERVAVDLHAIGHGKHHASVRVAANGVVADGGGAADLVVDADESVIFYPVAFDERSRIVAVVPDAGPRIVMDEIVPERQVGSFTHLLLRAVIGDLITLERRAVGVLPVVTTIAV